MVSSNLHRDYCSQFTHVQVHRIITSFKINSKDWWKHIVACRMKFIYCAAETFTGFVHSINGNDRFGNFASIITILAVSVCVCVETGDWSTVPTKITVAQIRRNDVDDDRRRKQEMTKKKTPFSHSIAVLLCVHLKCIWITVARPRNTVACCMPCSSDRITKDENEKTRNEQQKKCLYFFSCVCLSACLLACLPLPCVQLHTNNCTCIQRTVNTEHSRLYTIRHGTVRHRCMPMHAFMCTYRPFWFWGWTIVTSKKFCNTKWRCGDDDNDESLCRQRTR